MKRLVRRARAINADDAPKPSNSSRAPSPSQTACPAAAGTSPATDFGGSARRGRGRAHSPNHPSTGARPLVCRALSARWAAFPIWQRLCLTSNCPAGSRLREGQSRDFLNYDEVAQANAGDGLTLVPLSGCRPRTTRRSRSACPLAAGSAEFPRPAPGLPAGPDHKGNMGGKGFRLPGRGLQGIAACRLGTPLSFAPGAKLERDHIIFTVTRRGYRGELARHGGWVVVRA